MSVKTEGDESLRELAGCTIILVWERNEQLLKQVQLLRPEGHHPILSNKIQAAIPFIYNLPQASM